MNTELQKKIQQLTENDEFEQFVKGKLPQFKTTAIIHRWANHNTKRIHIKLRNDQYNNLGIKLADIRGHLKTITGLFPPTENGVISYAGKESKKTASPFILKFNNGVRNIHADLDYKSGEYEISIELPVDFYSDDVKSMSYRKVNDTEHHYFPGMSYQAMAQIQLPCYKMDLFETDSFYGGSKYTHIMDPEDKQEFEFVLLNGHTEEFAEFWQKQLETL